MPSNDTQTGFKPESYPLKNRFFQGGMASGFTGINTTAGPIHLADNEASNLQNIDFNKFGSIVKRGGYTALNTSELNSGASCDGLYWYEFVSGTTTTRYAVNISGGKMYYMDSLDGTWNDITGSTTITTGNHCDFESFLNTVYVTNGKNQPWQWGGSGDATSIPALNANSYTFIVTGVITPPSVGDTYQNNGVTFTVLYADSGHIIATGSSAPMVAGNLVRVTGSGDSVITFSAYNFNANIESAKFVAQFANYLFFANVVVSGTTYKTRIYWSNLQDPTTFVASNWLEVAMNDGQEITGLGVLSDRLVVYKTRSIYAVFYSGNSSAPFIMPGGGRTNSAVGCIAPFSIQEYENAHIFLAFDGIYTFDGNNSTKLSYQLDYTFKNSLDRDLLNQAVSQMYKTKNRYLLALTSSGNTQNDTIIVYDYYNTAFSVYKGMLASAMSTFYVDGWNEEPYFADYSGFTYQEDNGLNDYPLNTKTAIDAYYYTNWKTNDDMVHQKFSLSAYIFYTVTSGTLTFVYSYDMTLADQYSRIFSTTGGGALWGSVIWGAFKWALSGGGIQRIDLDGRGRTVRFGFKNSNVDETFSIDGFGLLTAGDTMV
jgi:hypothetical protein